MSGTIRERNGHLEEVTRSFDHEWSRAYRDLDRQALENGGMFDHYGMLLRDLSSSFGRPIQALDVGCGTGRYFHCLRNVDRLVGTDLSAHMLEQARNPVHTGSISIPDIELLCGELHGLSLEPARFDLIYSIGVFGEYSPLDRKLIQSFLRLLRPGGKFFITAVDAASRISVPERGQPSFARRVARKTLPILPGMLRLGINRVLSPFYTTRPRLEAIFRKAGVAKYEMAAYQHTSGWLGTHIDCIGFK
jgi:SAM-dependent methyltransferase